MSLPRRRSRSVYRISRENPKTEEYVRKKVETWTNEIKRLAQVATSQPHAAFAAFTHGLSSRWSYLTRTIPDIQDLLLPLEKEIHQTFIPAITGRPPCSELERDLLSLPARLGGMGLTNPGTVSQSAPHCPLSCIDHHPRDQPSRRPQPDPKIEELHPEREQTMPRPTGAEHL